MATDFLGQTLNVGDDVIFLNYNRTSANLEKRESNQGISTRSRNWPVVHGRWEYNLPTINTYGQLRCSICNWWTLDPSVDSSYNYCPNCGAKMNMGGGAE